MSTHMWVAIGLIVLGSMVLFFAGDASNKQIAGGVLIAFGVGLAFCRAISTIDSGF